MLEGEVERIYLLLRVLHRVIDTQE